MLISNSIEVTKTLSIIVKVIEKIAARVWWVPYKYSLPTHIVMLSSNNTVVTKSSNLFPYGRDVSYERPLCTSSIKLTYERKGELNDG